MSEVAVYRPPSDTWVDVISQVVKLSEHVADTEFVPKALRGNPPAIAAAILHGRELGLSPMTALSQTHMVEGKPTLSAEGQRGLVLAAGHEIEFTELTDATVTVRGRRAGDERWTSVTWTADRARRAGLAGKNTYRAYPRAMLAARASAELCRLMFADVTHGMAATEEIEAPEPPETATTGRTRRIERRPAPAPIEGTPAEYEDAEGDLAAIAEADTGDASPDETTPAPPTAVTPAQLRMLGALWSKFGVDDAERRDFTARLVGRDLEGTTRNLYSEEASALITVLVRITEDMPDDEGARRGALLHALEGADGG